MDPMATTALTPAVPNIFDTASGAFNTGTNAMAQTLAPGALPMSINAMMNPYINSVINNAVGRLRDRKAIDMSQVQTDAANASAFGGARHGLVEANLLDAYGQQEDELVSRLLQSGFDTSSSLALTDLSRRAGVGRDLVGVGDAGFNIGQRAVAGQAAAGAEQQNLIQRILTGGDIETQNYLNRPMQALQAIMAGLQGNPLNQATTTTTNTSTTASPMQMLGGVASILGAAK